jgi:hypothetical protein
MTNIFVKPKSLGDGKVARVRDPFSGLVLKAEGEWKALSSFWTRRVLGKDVVQATPPPVAAVAPVAPTPPAFVRCADCTDAVCVAASRCAKTAPAPVAPAPAAAPAPTAS